MKTFTRVAAQGEIQIRRIGDLPPANKRIPKGCTPLMAENGRYVIGHSETGHHHTLDTLEGVQIGVLNKAPAGMRILRAILEKPTILEHHRPYDTHEAIALSPGEYEFRIAREYDPYAELARRSAD